MLDAEALSRLARPGAPRTAIRAALRGAWEANASVQVPAAVLAELYRGGGHDQVVDGYLGRESGIEVIPTTRQLARVIGHVLARAGRESADHVDASVVAAVLATGGGVIATADPTDFAALTDSLPAVTVLAI